VLSLSSSEASALVASFGEEEITYLKFRAAFFLGTEVPEDLLRETFRRFGGDADGTITERDLRATLGGSFEGPSHRQFKAARGPGDSLIPQCKERGPEE